MTPVASTRPLYGEALALFRAGGIQLSATYASARLASLATQEGDTGQAAALFAESLEVFRQRAYPFGIALCLTGYAELQRKQGRVEQAVRLLASPGLLPAMSRRAVPVPRIEYERSVAAARAQLDEGTFSSAWEAGQKLTLEQAIALAQVASDG